MIKKITVLLVLFIGVTLLQSSLLKDAKCTGDIEYKKGLSKLGNFRIVKDYRISLKSGSAKKPPTISFPVSLTEGLTYKFLPVDNAINEGKMIMSIYMSSKKEMRIATTYNERSKKHYPAIEFNCGRTGTYQIFFTFTDGKKGCGVGLFGVKK